MYKLEQEQGQEQEPDQEQEKWERGGGYGMYQPNIRESSLLYWCLYSEDTSSSLGKK